jgi:hypothetical protein
VLSHEMFICYQYSYSLYKNEVKSDISRAEITQHGLIFSYLVTYHFYKLCICFIFFDRCIFYSEYPLRRISLNWFVTWVF